MRVHRRWGPIIVTEAKLWQDRDNRQFVCLRYFCLGTKVPRHSAGSVGTYINRIHSQRYCFAHAQAYKPCTNSTCGCGETGLYTQGAKLHSYTVVYASTRCLAHNVTHHC